MHTFIKTEDNTCPLESNNICVVQLFSLPDIQVVLVMLVSCEITGK